MHPVSSVLARAISGLTLAATLACRSDNVDIGLVPLTVTVTPAGGVSCAPGSLLTVGVSVSGGSGDTTVEFAPISTAVVADGKAAGGTFTFTCGPAGATSIIYTVKSGHTIVTGSIPVTVVPTSVPLVISIAPASLTVGVGAASAPLAATVTVPPTAPANISTAVRWFSDDPAIAAVDSLIGVVRGVAIGGTTIRAEAVAARSFLARAPVTVVGSLVVQDLTLGTSVLNLQQGATQSIAAMVRLLPNAPADASTGVTCTSSDTTAIRISGGATTPCTLTAVGLGVATVTVRSVADPTVSRTISVTVGCLCPLRVTIQSVTAAGPDGALVPIDPTNVSGTLHITFNYDPVDDRPDSLAAQIAGERVVCARFGARPASASGAADFSPVSCVLNTAARDSATGAPRVPNGQQNLAGTVYYHTGTAATGPGTSQWATINLPLTINNRPGDRAAVTAAGAGLTVGAHGARLPPRRRRR